MESKQIEFKYLLNDETEINIVLKFGYNKKYEIDDNELNSQIINSSNIGLKNYIEKNKDVDLAKLQLNMIEVEKEIFQELQKLDGIDAQIVNIIGIM